MDRTGIRIKGIKDGIVHRREGGIGNRNLGAEARTNAEHGNYKDLIWIFHFVLLGGEYNPKGRYSFSVCYEGGLTPLPFVIEISIEAGFSAVPRPGGSPLSI